VDVKLSEKSKALVGQMVRRLVRRDLDRQLAEVIEWHRSEALLQQGLFGLGEPHPELAARIGDYTLMMNQGHVIQDPIAGERPFAMVGYHGGLSAAEMYVPLVVAAC
jgi:hypothetical protein